MSLFFYLFDSTWICSYAVDGQTYKAHGILPANFYQCEDDSSHSHQSCLHLRRWRMVLTGDRCVYTSAQLIIVTCVLHVVVMRLILVLFVLDLTLVLFFGIFVALFEGVITLWSVHRHRARLECLVAVIRRNLVLLFLLTFHIVVVAIVVVTTLSLVVLMIIRPALPAVVAATPVMLVRNTVDLLFVTLVEQVAELVICMILNLTLAFPCKGAIGYLGLEDFLQVFCNRLKCLIAKALPAFYILGTILGVERHVEPLEL
jgi:hypothetical protein